MNHFVKHWINHRDLCECQNCGYLNTTVPYDKAKDVLTICMNCAHEMLLEYDYNFKMMVFKKMIGPFKLVPFEDPTGNREHYCESQLPRNDDEMKADIEYQNLKETFIKNDELSDSRWFSKK